MERLLFVPDIMARYGYKSPKSARKIMLQMAHLVKPKLAVMESAVWAWEREHTRGPGQETARKAPARRSQWEQPPRDERGNYIIPRRRA